MKVIGKPYCEILDLLNRPELAKSGELRHDVGRLGDVDVPEIQRLFGGRSLSLSLHALDFASYIYVVYLSSDGESRPSVAGWLSGQEARASRAIRDRKTGRRRLFSTCRTAAADRGEGESPRRHRLRRSGHRAREASGV